MLTIIKTYYSRFIILLVALQVLNLGLYAQDFEAAQQSNGKELNIINSVTEYVAEVVMQKHNAFPEKKEKSNQSDHESAYKFQPFKIFFRTLNLPLQTAVAQHVSYGSFIVNPYINHTTDITSPPPKYKA